jgi:uncharacterized RDD family membrane protein YckC
VNDSAHPLSGDRATGLPYPPEPPLVRDDLPDKGPGAPASWGLRAGARIFDYILLSLPAAALADALGTRITSDGWEGPIWPRFIFPVAFIAYETIFIAWRGNTVGKFLFRVKAVSWERGTLASVQEAGIRALLPGIFLLVAVAGGLLSYLQFVPIIIYLSSLTHPVYRGWHDRAADTIVLSAPRGLRP